MGNTGLVFDIQSFSVHDGPGCRTSIFLMGCPLRCEWCANPEGFEQKERVLFRSSKCSATNKPCERCITACPSHSISRQSGMDQEAIQIDWKACSDCSELTCIDACLAEALVKCGRQVTVPELMKILQRDRKFWGTGGGVTFTGGEPLYQGEFLLGALQACQEAYLHTAIETTSFADQDLFLKIMKYVDFAFLDMKHMDSEEHKRKTGVGNEIIHRNIRALATSNWPGRAVVRVPVIAGFNDTEENVRNLIKFMKELGLTELNLLPFHPLGESKWRQCGMVYPYALQPTCEAGIVEKMGRLFQEQGMKCYLGSETPF